MNTSIKVAIAAEFELAEKICEFLEQSNIDIEILIAIEIYPFKEEQGLRFGNKAVAQIASEEVNWADFDYLLLGGSVKHANLLADAAQAGCIAIDMQGICANLNHVPLVVPTVNDEVLGFVKDTHIVSLPNPQVSQLVLAVASIAKNYPLNHIFVSSMLPASYVDSEQVSKLVGQTAQLLNGIPLDEGQTRLAFDVRPETLKDLATQCQRLLFGMENVQIHSVHTPIFYGISQMITLNSSYEFSTDDIKTQWQSQDFTNYHQELITPVTNGEQENNEENVHLHIHQLQAGNGNLTFWTVADEQRFNVAFLAVQVLERIIKI